MIIFLIIYLYFTFFHLLTFFFKPYKLYDGLRFCCVWSAFIRIHRNNRHIFYIRLLTCYLGFYHFLPIYLLFPVVCPGPGFLQELAYINLHPLLLLGMPLYFLLNLVFVFYYFVGFLDSACANCMRFPQ